MPAIKTEPKTILPDEPNQDVPVDEPTEGKAKKAPKAKAKPAKAPKANGVSAKEMSKKETSKKEGSAEAPKKAGLRKPQVRILSALAKIGEGGLTRAQIAEKAPVDVAACVEYIGSADPDIRAANDEKHFPSLISLRYVKQSLDDVDGRDKILYSISASGRKALEKASK